MIGVYLLSFRHGMASERNQIKSASGMEWIGNLREGMLAGDLQSVEDLYFGIKRTH